MASPDRDAQHHLALAALRRAREAYTEARVPMEHPEAWTAEQRTAVNGYASAWQTFALSATAAAVAHDADPWGR